MRKEIDILLKAAGKNCAVVEKATHLVWTTEDLIQASGAGRFQQAARILPPDARMPVSSPYPGCVQLGGAGPTTLGHRLVGQTEHFAIFAATTDASRELSLE